MTVPSFFSFYLNLWFRLDFGFFFNLKFPTSRGLRPLNRNLVQRRHLWFVIRIKKLLLTCYQAELLLVIFWESDLAGCGTCTDFCSDPLNFLQPYLFVRGRCLPLHVGGHVMSSDWKLYIGFQLEVARAIMSRTGCLDVLTANAVRCIPKSEPVWNSPTGVCSMFMFRICLNEKRIGTSPLSGMSTHVVIQPVWARSLRQWITSLSLTVDCSPFANKSLLEHGSLERQMWSRFECCWQACTRRSIEKRDPMALVPSESRKTYVGWEPRSTYSQGNACWAQTMVIIGKYTLFRKNEIERACVRLERMQVTGFGRNTFLNLADALK